LSFDLRSESTSARPSVMRLSTTSAVAGHERAAAKIDCLLLGSSA
jgi:hypothetical protein